MKSGRGGNVKVVDDWTSTLVVALPLCRNFDMAVDGGASDGMWSRELGKHFAEVLAVEPQYQLAERIKQNAPGARVIVAALSSQEQVGGSAYLAETPKRLGRSRARFVRYDDTRGASIRPDVAVNVLEPVATCTIDSLVNGESCGLIKLDIEGAEIEALRGAKQTLGNSLPVVIVEYLRMVTEKHYAFSLKHVDEYMSKCGYKDFVQCGNNRIFYVRM